MLLKSILLSILGIVVTENECYWNRQCSYQLFATVTPYDTVRGDIRDYPSPKNCKAVSMWSLHRHGNRYPGRRFLSQIKPLQAKLRQEILRSDAENRCSLCAQDIEDILNWKWNFALDTSPSDLTRVGYEELYSIGKRIRKKYSELLIGSSDKFYFRATVEQRTNASVRAFVQGLTEGTEKDLSSRIDETRARDDVLRPQDHCDLYLNWVQNGPRLAAELDAFDNSPENLAVRDRVLNRLGITYQLSLADIFGIYELCRYYRSWSSNLQCPWCAVFTDEDLMVLEYRDDVRHYFKNGYGSPINALFGGPALKDLYEHFVAATRGEGKNIVSYFTHGTLVEMVFAALGLYEDPTAIRGATMNTSRLWRTSYISPFSTSFIAILIRCEKEDTYRVQFLINEKVTTLCPVEGCTWEEFVTIFQTFSNSTLSFCSQEQPSSEETITNNYAVSRLASSVLILVPLVGILFRLVIDRLFV